MEEEKAAAYYDKLTRKGGGAARFKQGLGFSSSSSSSKPLPSSSSSLLSSFVRASSPGRSAELERKAQLSSIQKKLQKNHHDESSHRRYPDEREERERERRRERDRERERRDNSYDKRRTSRSRSPSRRGRDQDRESERRKEEKKEKGSKRVDYSELIKGYDRMTPAERVKAKLKLQLSETAAKDSTKGMAKGWERFDFDKDAPLDDFENIEAADDDVSLTKNISKSFRINAVETKWEDELRAKHDEAMFGVSSSSIVDTDNIKINNSNNNENSRYNNDDDEKDSDKVHNTALISDMVFSKQQGSWRDRARKFRDDCK